MRFEIHTRRHPTYADTYEIARIRSCWRISGLGRGGDSDLTGVPDLFAELQHDCINYPAGLAGCMKWLWEKSGEEKMSEAEIQRHLDVLAEWVSLVETNSRTGIVGRI